MAQLSPVAWIRDSRQFVADARGEFRKVTWPSRQEALGGTIGVLVVAAVITLVLGVVDVGLAELIRFVVPR